MALPTSGQIDLNAIHVEAGGTTQTEVSLNDSDVRGLISKDGSTQNAFSEYYGASSSVIQSGDGFFWWYSMANVNGQPSPQFTFAAVVVKLGGSVVKGSFTAGASNGGSNPSSGQSWHNGTTTQSNNFNFLANISYTHTDGFTYVPNSPLVSGDTSTYPTVNSGGSIPQPQSAYENRGIKLQ